MSMKKQLFRIMWSQSRREASAPPNRRLLSQRRLNGFQGAGLAIPSVLGTSESTTTTNTTTAATTTSNQSSNNNWIQGETLNLAADLRTFRPGDKLDIPYEMTITDGMQDFWQSAFHAQDRIHTSRPWARKMGLQDRVLPFALVLFLATSMTHADSAKVQVGFGRVAYLWPAFAGDTVTKSFTVKSIRNTSDGHHSIIHITCDLINQRGRLCMRAEKRMLFDFSVPESNVQTSALLEEEDDKDPPNMYMFRDHLMSKSNVCQELRSHSLADLRPGQLILHSMHRSLTLTQSQQLASLARLTHEKHFDSRKYDPTELLIPGGLVLGLTSSASARDFHELLHEEILNVNYVNPLHPGNMVGAISYIQSVEEAVGDLEVIAVRTLGIKNMNVQKDLADVNLPQELFDMGTTFKAKEIQKLCKIMCPQLQNKIVVQVDRRILRQAARQQVFLL